MSLLCPTCGLPAVPFGGEDICLDPEHEDRGGIDAGPGFTWGDSWIDYGDDDDADGAS